MNLFSVEEQHQQECVVEDNYYAQDEISLNLPPVEKDSVQFGNDHAGKIIHSARVGCGLYNFEEAYCSGMSM